MLSGVILEAEQRDTPAGEQPPTVRRSVFRLARGTEIDTGAEPRCRATDAELQADGLDACPGASRLGTGEADVFLGESGEQTLGVTAFNTEPGLVVALTLGDSVARVIRARVRGRRITAKIPRLELAGGYEAALTRFELRIGRHGTKRRPWLRTPAKCPERGPWRTSYLAIYDEPTGRQLVRDRQRCRG